MAARFHQVLLALSMLALCWFGMMAVHESGHVVGAWATGGTVNRVVLNPLTISRTDVLPNPSPAIVVWMGPLVGCVLPILAVAVLRRVLGRVNIFYLLAVFFAGFCLLANGAYIAIGAFDGVGDCGVMLKTGSPFGALLVFGTIAMIVGFMLWHRLGSLRDFIANPDSVEPATAWILTSLLIAVLAAEFMPFPM